MKTLDEIALKWGTDKSSAGHGYTKVYEEYLPRDTKSMLELGLAKGYSALTWRDYFDHGFQLTVLDWFKDPNHVNANWCKGKGFKVYQGDGREVETYTQIKEEFDVIIDDMSHSSSSQILSFANLFPNNLKTKGYFAIEDVHCCKEEFYRDGGCLKFEDTILGTLQNYLKGPKKGKIVNPLIHQKEAARIASMIDSVEILCDEKLVLIKKK